MTKSPRFDYSLFVVITDILLMWAALLSATVARIHVPLGIQVPTSVWTLPFPVYIIAGLVWLAIFSLLNVHTPLFQIHLSKELQRVILASSVSWLLLIGILYLSYREVSRLQTLYFLGFVLVYLSAFRILLRWVLARLGPYRIHTHRVLVVGTGVSAQEFTKNLDAHQANTFVLVGYVNNSKPDPSYDDPAHPVLGTVDDLPRLIREENISELIIALPWDAQHGVPDLVQQLQYLPVNLRVVPDYFDMAFLSLRIEDFWGIPLVTLKEPVLTPVQRLTKRGFDIIVTLPMLMVAIPIMLAVAVSIKLDDGGPIFFLQDRVGEGKKIFRMYKFRSMRPDAPLVQAEINKVDERGTIVHKSPDDPRVTRVGKFIRRISLDELPQLFNILRGDMSLVGPRPELPWLVEQYEPWQSKRFEVPQGLTGWWQINGRSRKLMHESTDEDLYYIRNYSIWLDVIILFRTIGVVLSGDGAF